MMYKVSVVTPFHNVEESMFKNCVKSMLNQTIGFKNIEWIVVLHNCTEESIEVAQKYLSMHDNVKLPVLNNEARTPSSPRNYGTTLATGYYISYLDGDDSYRDNCLEVAIREAEETQSQVVWYRRESEKESPELVIHLPTTFCDNIKKRVVIEKGNWDYKIMFSGLFGFVTSYLFNLKFLRSKKLMFSEKIHFGEDFMFVAQALVQADRICYLPQHIGYHYYVNANSLVQQGEKSAEQLITYAKGFRDMFAMMRSYGIDPNENAQIMFFAIARFILGSPKLTRLERVKIKHILSPDVIRMYILPPDKNFSLRERELMFCLSQDVILNPDNPGKSMLKIFLDGLMELRSIIFENLDTDFGRHYNFQQITHSDAFQFLVPLTNAEYYKKIIPLQTNVGEKYIITKSPIKRYYRKKDGTMLPSTTFNSHIYAKNFASLLAGKTNILFARSMPVYGTTNDDSEIDTLYSSIVKDYFSEYFLKRGIIQAHLTSPIITYFKQERTEDDYMDIMTDALAHSDDVNQIVAFDTDELLRAFTTLEYHWQEMVEKIPNEKRRNEVREILSEGFKQSTSEEQPKSIAQQLWPNIERIVAFGTGEYFRSAAMLKRYIGDQHYNNGFYFTEESILGKASGDDTNLFECMKKYDFYELIPIDATEDQKPFKWSEVENGKLYYLVITTHAGLYRYKTEYVIMPVDVSVEKILFKVY